MATTPDFIEYVCEQMSGTGFVRYRKMFGEYMVSLNDKPVLFVCDNTVFVKPLDCVADKLKDAEQGIPYQGAKAHYILDIDNAELSRKLSKSWNASPRCPNPERKSPEFGIDDHLHRNKNIRKPKAADHCSAAILFQLLLMAKKILPGVFPADAQQRVLHMNAVGGNRVQLVPPNGHGHRRPLPCPDGIGGNAGGSPAISHQSMKILLVRLLFLILLMYRSGHFCSIT